MAYELWDTESGNLLGAYTTEATALAVVRQAINEHGSAYVATLALAYESPSGATTTIAEGTALIHHAQPTLVVGHTT